MHCLGEDEGIARSELTSVRSPRHEYRAVNISSDLLGALLHRGEQLREAMVMSADENSAMEEPEGMHNLRKGSVNKMAVRLHFSQFVLCCLLYMLCIAGYFSPGSCTAR